MPVSAAAPASAPADQTPEAPPAAAQTPTTQTTTQSTDDVNNNRFPLGKTDPYAGLTTRKDNDLSRLMSQVGAYMVVLLALAVGALVVVKRYLPKIRQASGKHVILLETTGLGPRQCVHLLQVGNAKLLVASSKDDIRFLADVTAALAPEKPAASGSAPAQEAP